jgi:hypothetical protein
MFLFSRTRLIPSGRDRVQHLHSYIAPLLLGLIAHFGQVPVLLPIALIWIAHIGLDRAFGYGLKYGSAFGDTHLGQKGRPRNRANATKDIAN